ncbi:MAG: hypothetical protein KGJ13_01755, partial [Patescibacteria group bacterium]|nr:hypothetical protein [Patescibacteria group bacterium]
RGRRSAATASRPSYLTEENTRFDHPLPFDERKTEMNILLKKTHRFFLNSDSLVKRYWSRELQVEPQAFFNQLKQVKVRIYAED